MNYVKYVNIKQGTDSQRRYSNGNTLPIVTSPFGMNNFCPQTEGKAEGWYYNPGHKQIEGIRLTHQPSPWIGDYGHIIFSPQCGRVYVAEDDRSSGYRPMESILQPSYLKINFLRYRSQFELTPSERGAVFRVSWEADDIPRFAVIPFNYYTEIKLNVDKKLLTGYTKAYTGGASNKFALYFAMYFDKEIDVKNTVITRNNNSYEQGLEGKGTGVGINIAFKCDNKNPLEAKLGTSFISTKQAQLNLQREIGDRSFDDVRKETELKWDNLLSKVEVEMNCEEELRTFYTNLYRCCIFPRMFYEYNEKDEVIHHRSTDGSVRYGYMYTDNGFWDTYRTVYPLLAILAPDRLREMLYGFINFYKEEGWLPRWISPGERGAMPGTLIDAVLADGAVKGVLEGEYLEKALEGMLKHATIASSSSLHGRTGIKDYLKYGYLPREFHKESVNNTLDNAYGDFCIAAVAKLLGKDEIADEFYKRSNNYKNVFDKETLFCRGRDINGNMKKNFDPFEWGGEYCEGGAWQNSFGVYHDILGLADLMGGKNKLIEKIDELFSTPPIYKVGAYGIEIHEMTEMAAADFGQCAISNQPSFHIPYIYAAAGKPKSTQYWVRRLMSEAFDSSESGLPGDEDNGTMAAWYVFSALGFYPFCPGTTEYVIGSPLVKKAVISLANGGKTIIYAEENDKEHIYVESWSLDGEVRSDMYLDYKDIMKGSSIEFKMSIKESLY